MELDELKSAWQALDRRLEQQSTLQAQLWSTQRLDATRTSLRPLWFGQIGQILFGLLLIGWAGSFWFAHRDVLHLLIPGALLHVYGVMAIALAAATLVNLRRIDYAAPVLEIQKQLGKLRRAYVLRGLCVGLPWWLLWVSVLQLAAMELFQTDLYLAMGPWFWCAYVGGIVGLLASAWLQRWARDPRRPRLAAAVDANLTAGSLRNAQRFLDELARFEHS